LFFSNIFLILVTNISPIFFLITYEERFSDFSLLFTIEQLSGLYLRFLSPLCDSNFLN